MDVASITPSPYQLKALTHPVRLRMLGLLRVEGPATATMLANRLGLNTGASSYHLRQLAQHGFVEEAAELGDARDRWWRAAHRSTTTGHAGAGDRESEEALEAYLQTVAVVMTEQLQCAVEELPLVPPPWAEASTFSDWVLRLTPMRAKALVDALTRELSEVREEDGETSAQFVIQLSAFPLPGYVAREQP